MLESIAIILIVLWLFGIVSGYTLGNFIYVLLVIAVVLFLVRLMVGPETRVRKARIPVTGKPIAGPCEHNIRKLRVYHDIQKKSENEKYLLTCLCECGARWDLEQ